MDKILGKVRACTDRYNMIEENDIIAVGVSGGKDSMVLLSALARLRDFYPKIGIASQLYFASALFFVARYIFLV